MTTISLDEAFADSDREFWHGVLTGGGFTPIPRWTRDPVPGVAVCEAAVPRDLLPALRQRAAELRVPLSSVLLAAHAKVLAALVGESEVVTGYLAGIRSVPRPCRLAAAAGTWRAMLLQAHRTEWELLAHQDFPVGDLAGELGLTGAAFETVFDALGGEGALAPGTVLWVSIWPHRGRLALRLRYRTDVLDADAAARIAGYHLTALALIAADPEAEHGQQSLLGPAEFGFQLDALAGPHRERPTRRMHELFEQRVREHPDAIAAIRWVSCSTMSSSVVAPGKNRPCCARKSSTWSWLGSRPSSRSSSRLLRSRTMSRFAASSSGVVPWIASDRPSTKRSSVCFRSRSVSALNRSRASGSMKSYSSSFRIRPPTSRGSASSWSIRRAAASRSIFRRAGSLGEPSGGDVRLDLADADHGAIAHAAIELLHAEFGIRGAQIHRAIGAAGESAAQTAGAD
jgi:hypothetical protein